MCLEKTYEFELVRIRNQNFIEAYKVFKAENTILAGAQGFALLIDFSDSLARNAGIVSFSNDPTFWLYQTASEGVPYLYVRNNGTIELEVRPAYEEVGHTYVLRIKQA